MIIFDLDGTLADCEHRRHFVDPNKNWEINHKWIDLGTGATHLGIALGNGEYRLWQPEWKSLYEACDKDGIIIPCVDTFRLLSRKYECQIRSGRCESVKEKTVQWLYECWPNFMSKEMYAQIIKMRSIGDNTPDADLKEMWLHDAVILEGKKIDFVFDSDPESIKMWRRRGIFVFNC